MTLSEEQVRKVANLANLHLDADEVLKMSSDLGSILTHIEQLTELETRDVEPMTQVLFEADETATLREDRPHTPLTNEEALSSAALIGNGYFKVPKVIER